MSPKVRATPDYGSRPFPQISLFLFVKRNFLLFLLLRRVARPVVRDVQFHREVVGFL